MNVKVNLKTDDLKLIAQKVTSLNKLYESQWAALRNNPSITPPSIRAAAVKLLGSFGLKPRLARNLDDLRRIVDDLTGRGVAVQFVKEAQTFTGDDSSMSKLLLSVMGAFAEFERSLIRERQLEGILLLSLCTRVRWGINLFSSVRHGS